MRTLKRFIELELAKIEPLWTAEGKGSYWWGVRIGLETVLAKLCEMDGTVMPNAPQPEHRRYDPNGSLSEYGIFPECDTQQSAAVDEAMVERIAALLYEEATGDPWTVAGVEYEGPDRDYYRKLARKVLALAAQQPAEQQPAAVDMTKRELFTMAAVHTLRAGDYAKWEHLAQDAVNLADAILAALAAQPHADDEVVFIDGVGAARSSVKSCHDGVQWIKVGDRIYWPLSDSDAKRLHSACCGDGSFDGPTSPAGEGEEVTVNTPYGVFTLPLQPSELSSGPRFVVHVPSPETPAVKALVEALETCLETEERPEVIELAKTALAAASQLARDGCHCGTCTCDPNMTPAVRFDLSPAQHEGVIRDHLIRLGWTPPGEHAQQPAAPSETINVVGMPEFDSLLDHIYEHGVMAEGVIEKANAFAQAVRNHLIRQGWTPPNEQAMSQQPEERGGGESEPPSAAAWVDFAAVASILRRAMRDGVHYGYMREFILQQALALEALSQQQEPKP